MIPHKVKLSGALAAIAEVIGFGAALRLAHEFGGHEVTIPKYPRLGQKLVDCIGLAAAEKLTAHYGTGPVGIPLGPAGTYNQFIRGQAQKIDQALAEGKNHVQTAREVGCTTRTVQAHKNHVPDKKQAGLFD